MHLFQLFRNSRTAVAPVPATPGANLALELLCVDLAVDDVDQLPVAERRRLLSAAVSAAAEDDDSDLEFFFII